MGRGPTRTRSRRRAGRRLTLAEAAGAVGLSVPTLRRHIRTGRLAAERVRGKYGQEYRVEARALATLGLPVTLPPKTAVPPRGRRVTDPSAEAEALGRLADAVPRELRALRRELARLRTLLARLGRVEPSG